MRSWFLLGGCAKQFDTYLWVLLQELRPPHPSPSQVEDSNFSSVQFSSVTQSCPTLCDPMNCSTPGLPVCHQLPESTQTHVHWVGDAIQPSHPLSSTSPPALNLSQHQGCECDHGQGNAEVLGLLPCYGIFFTWTPLSESSLLTLVKVPSLWKRKQNSFTLKQFWGFTILIKWQKNAILKCFLFLEKLCTFKMN